MDERLWTAEDVAGFVGVATDTVYRWVRRRELPHVRIGSTLRFEPDAVRRWVRGAAVEPIDGRTRRVLRQLERR